MSFADFERAIVSPALRQIAQHWNNVRAGKRMPAWSDIKPAAIAPHLPIVWAYRYDSTNDGFIGRLSGERIAQVFGKNLRGLSLRDIYPPADYPRLFARMKRVVTEPAFHRNAGLVFRHLDRHGVGERIIMPLSADGIHADGIVGATEYEHRFSAGQDKPETEEWFALD